MVIALRQMCEGQQENGVGAFQENFAKTLVQWTLWLGLEKGQDVSRERKLRPARNVIPTKVMARRQRTGSGVDLFVHSYVQQKSIEHLPVTDVVDGGREGGQQNVMSRNRTAHSFEC